MNILKKYFKRILIFVLGITGLCTGEFVLDAWAISSGEVITYDIKKMGLKAGEARLQFNGPTQRNGQPVILITFTATSFKFLDEEKIYVDPKTFYPVAVERNLNIFGKKEKITEEYSQDKGLIKVRKTAGGKVVEQTFQKSAPIDNIYCFIYRFRNSGQFYEGSRLLLKLPTKDVSIYQKRKEQVKIAGQSRDSFFMQSDPKEYNIWFDTGPNKIPLRIDGAVGLAKTSMVMTSYRGVK